LERPKHSVVLAVPERYERKRSTAALLMWA
jgi:hypothetical protein